VKLPVFTTVKLHALLCLFGQIIFIILFSSFVVVLGGVSVLAIGPKVRGFKPGREMDFLTGIKIRRTSSFGGEVKTSVHAVRLHGMLKILSEYEQIYFVRSNSLFPSPVPSTLLLDGCW
jgi:hypothetical protein